MTLDRPCPDNRRQSRFWDRTAANLATLLGEVLSDATYGDNARRIQKAIVKTNGLSLAADLVEQSLQTTVMASLT
jgi:UDP:flavonoid glycosyltransferase YjiC (YdhE family)